MRRRCHALREGADVVLAPVARALAVEGVRIRSHLPNGRHGQPVDLPDLGESQQLAAGPAPGTESVAVNPSRGIRVSLDLEIVLELLVADRPALVEESFDLWGHQRIAFQGGGVVGFVVPDLGPDALGFLRAREPTEARAELFDRKGESVVDGLSGRPASGRHAG